VPAQPLSSVRSDAQVFVGASSGGVFRPALAQLAAQVVATWADIEYQLGGMLATMLGANAAPSIAMFYALTSGAAQMAALRAAAASVLDEGSRDHELFEVIIQQAERAARPRHRFAHWVWGHCNELPDALLLIDPEALVKHDMADNRFHAPHDGRGLLGPLDRSRVYVYREQDITEILADLEEASYCASHFRMLLIPKLRGQMRDRVDDIYERLLDRPGIAAALTRHRKRQKAGSARRASRGRRARKN